MSHGLLSILLVMPSKVNHDQMVMQGEVLESSIMTHFKYTNCLMEKKVHLNIQNGMFHGTTTV